MSYPQRSLLAALVLFFIAPLVAEYLLGDFTITFLAPLIVMTPMYGGGALLIREVTRRAGRGWPTILLLGCAYAIVEEAFTTQTLFNPDIFGMHAHFLSHGWIPALGIGAWWTLFMLNVHAFWSIGVSIALVEGLFPSRARTPWLGKVGLSVVAVLFAIGVFVNTAYTLHHDPFRASRTQFIVSALCVIAFAAIAFLIPKRAPDHPSPVPSPWITGLAAFILGAAVMLPPLQWNWGAVAWVLAADFLFLLFLGLFSRSTAWTPLHAFSIGAAGALVYGAHAFIGNPVVPAPKSIVLISHIVCLVLALAVVTAAALRTRSALREIQLQ